MILVVNWRNFINQWMVITILNHQNVYSMARSPPSPQGLFYRPSLVHLKHEKVRYCISVPGIEIQRALQITSKQPIALDHFLSLKYIMKVVADYIIKHVQMQAFQMSHTFITYENWCLWGLFEYSETQCRKFSTCSGGLISCVWINLVT